MEPATIPLLQEVVKLIFLAFSLIRVVATGDHADRKIIVEPKSIKGLLQISCMTKDPLGLHDILANNF